MGDKGEGGVKNLKKWVTSMMDAHIVFILSLCTAGNFLMHNT